MRDRKKITVALLQMSMSNEPKENIKKAIRMIREAKLKGAEIVCLPELFNLQYFPQRKSKEFFQLAEKIPSEITSLLSKSAKENELIIIGGSLFEKGNNGRFYNSSVIFDNKGKILGKYSKVHIPYDPYFFEKDYFTSGEEYKVFDTPYAKIGVLICYDQWFPEAARVNALMGAEIIFYPTAIGWFDELRKLEPWSQKRWEIIQCSHASANGIFVASVNRVGKEDKIEFWGNSFVSDPFGNVITNDSSNKEDILIAKIDLNLIASSQDGWGFLRNRKPETYGIITKTL